MIRASDRVAAVIAQDEGLIEVFASASPAFEKLRNAAMRRTMARLVTVEQAARIAGLDAEVLVERLNRALEGGPKLAGEPAPGTPEAPPVAPLPAALRAIPEERVVDVDVREDLRAGREPFRRILDAVQRLPDDGVLRLRAIFEPVPLYGVLAKRGLGHFTERLADDDWRVWFHREAGAAPARAASEPEARPLGDDLVMLDVRGLEPPEPLMRTLEALAVMPRGKTLVQLNVRVPQLLLPKLDERGFTYEIREQSADLVRLFIRHR
jgi:hypothetical protein